jgi:uncharacterized coiled-coil DUF342 family protein
VTEPTEEMMKEMNEELSKIIAASEQLKASNVKPSPRSNDLDKYLIPKTSRLITPPPRQRLYDDEDDDDCFRPNANIMSSVKIFEDFEEEIKDEGKINEIHDEVSNLSSLLHNMLSQMTKNNRTINDKLNKVIGEIHLLHEEVRAIDKRIDDVQIEMEQYLIQIEKKSMAIHPSHHPGFA